MTAKADRVRHLLEDEDLKEAFANVREYYRDMIEACPVGDDMALKDVRMMLQLLRDVEDDLYRTIQNGNLEDSRAQQQRGFLGVV